VTFEESDGLRFADLPSGHGQNEIYQFILAESRRPIGGSSTGRAAARSILNLNGWTQACKRAGVPGLLFHDLCRSAVRNMKKAGLQHLEAMRISGHLTRNVFDRYNIIDEEDLVEAGKRLEDYAQKRKQERAAKLRRVK
jgi:hypothetical protein